MDELSNTKPSKPTNDDCLPPLDSLRCYLCKDFFTEPVTLDCLHSFCKDCLDKYIKENPVQLPPQIPNPDGSMPPPPPPPAIECPICIQQLNICQTDSYAEPFDNARLARIVKLVHETNVLCQNCGESQSEVKCSICDSYLCIPCWNLTHEAPVFQSHVQEALRHSEMNSLPKCPQHTISDLEFFCTDEEIGVCQVCLLKGDFVGRTYRIVSDVCKERQDEINNGINKVTAQREALEAANKKNDEVLEELNANFESQCESVHDNFRAIREALDAREKATIQALSDLKDAKSKVLNNQKDAVNRLVGTINDGVDSVKLVLNHSNDLEVVYMTDVLQHRISTISQYDSTSPSICKDCKKSGALCHCPSVTPDLPVQLSDKIPKLVDVYAQVPQVHSILSLVPGEVLPPPVQHTPEQQKLVKDVAKAADGDASGCVLQ